MKKHHQILSILAFAAGAALLSACGAGKKDADAFLKEAARSGMKEVELSSLALQRASHPEVRDFAQRMIEDHGRVNQEVQALAERKRVRLPDRGVDASAVGDHRLAERSGREFDREYMRLNVEEHEKAVELFRKQAQEGKDADVRAFAGRTLPALQEHLETARNLRDRVERGEGMPEDTTMARPGENVMPGEPMRSP